MNVKTTNKSKKNANAKSAAARAKAAPVAPSSKKGKVTKTQLAAKPRRVSALDAAYAVLVKASGAMATKELIALMADEGLWQSPGGKTPWATLYAALLREINTKGRDARFRKVDRGQFEAIKGRK